jgi:hypothetical protein
MSNNNVKLDTNISITKGEIFPSKGLREGFHISEGSFNTHNLALDIGKAFMLKSMGGSYGCNGPILKYLGVGRNRYPNGGTPAPSSVLAESLSDPDPFYIAIGNPIYQLLPDKKYPTAMTYITYIIGEQVLFDHFEIGSTTLSIGEIGLFFESTDPDGNWGIGPNGKLLYTIFARDNILEKKGTPITLTKSTTPGVYQAYKIGWTVYVR